MVLLILLLVTFQLSAEEFRTIYNLKIFTDKTIQNNKSLWESVKGSIIYEIKQVNYYKLIVDEDILDAKLVFSLRKVVSDYQFVFNCTVIYKKDKKSLRYKVNSKEDFEKLPDKFIHDLKSTLPLKGIIFEKKNLNFKANIGRYYNVKKGDIFFIIDDKKIKGVAEVLKAYNHYSQFIVTSLNQSINDGDILVPFTYQRNQQYHLFPLLKIQKVLTRDYQIRGVYRTSFSCISSIGQYFALSDEKETGIFNNQDHGYERIEKMSYNQISDLKFNLQEEYSAYIVNKNSFKIVRLEDFEKFILKRDSDKNEYKFILSSDRNIYQYEDVPVSQYAFYKNHDLVVFDSSKKKFISLDMKNNTFQDISITEELDELKSIAVTPNHKLLIVLDNKGKLLIKDLIEQKKERTINKVDTFILSKTGVHIYYQKDKTVHQDNLYIQENQDYSIKTELTDLLLSYSERFLFFYKEKNPNTLNYIDISDNKIFYDVFRPGMKKYIIKIDKLYNDSIVIYGILIDMDHNKKLDYRDINQVMYFDYKKNKTKKIIKNLDEYYGLSNHNRYLLYNSNEKLMMKDFKYEKVSQ